MPDKPIKPINKRVDELTTKLTYEEAEKFANEIIPFDKQKKIASYALRELAYYKELVKEMQKVIDGLKKK